MPPDVRAIPGVNDSKQLRPDERRRLAMKIRERAVCFGIGAASVREIDRVNIYHATVIAMRRALSRLGVVPNHVLVDGKPIRTLECSHTALVGGDDKCYTIACASILAKVTRDRIMQSLAPRYPNYRWERNVGYCTLAHLDGLAEHGVTPHHRRSFIPVRQLSFDLSGSAAPDVDLAALASLIEASPETSDDLHFAGD
jgi:ribonuclease HII